MKEVIRPSLETEKRRAIVITEPAESYSAGVADNEYGILPFGGQTGLLVPLFIYKIVGKEKITELIREQFSKEALEDENILQIDTTDKACLLPNLPSLTRMVSYPNKEELPEIRKKIDALIERIEHALEEKEKERFN